MSRRVWNIVQAVLLAPLLFGCGTGASDTPVSTGASGAETTAYVTSTQGATPSDGVKAFKRRPAPSPSPSPSPSATPLPAPAQVTFTIDTTANRRPISSYIYGINSHDWASRPAGVTLSRLGGNRWTAYNWTNNASNAGTDWYNQNDSYLGGGDTAGEAVRPHVAEAHARDASMVVTIPIQGYVAADKLGNGDVNQTPDYLSTRFRPSVARKGTAFQNPPLTSGTVYQDEFTWWLESRFPSARTTPTRTIFYSLDNEPDLWPSTHPRIHPSAVRYDELISKTIEYAGAIKAVAPQAVVFGPVSYGWNGYVNLQNAPDAGGRDFLDTYMAQLTAASQAAGKRLVDVLDLHWYPEAQGAGVRITTDSTTAALTQARVQAPRSLWDPTYIETSWITQWSTQGPIRLIPRLQSKIQTHAPGTKLAFTEYYYGGGGDISGGIAQADVLGIFGREGVFAANLWKMGMASPTFIYGGFEMFRDYDGAGGKVGDTSVSASTSDVASTSVYATTDGTSDNRVVVVAINKTASPLPVNVQVSHPWPFTSAEIYQLTSASSRPVRAADMALGLQNRFTYTMPAMSVSTLVLRAWCGCPMKDQ